MNLLFLAVVLLTTITLSKSQYQTGCANSVSVYNSATYVSRGVAILQSTTNVQGTLSFTQPYMNAPVSITGSISGLTPGNHGFHIHQLGNLTGGCVSSGGHFNPYLLNHGGPTAPIRHVGDLGNINADASGVANVAIVAPVISLNGPTSIIGRAVVVHANPDDLGLGGATDSLTTGNAGGRVACAVVGVAQEQRLSFLGKKRRR